LTVGCCFAIANPRQVLLVSLFIEVLGHLLYATANNRYVILVARIFAGIGLGNESAINSYISKVTTPEQRSVELGAMQLAIALAYAAGPGLSIGLSFIDFSIGSFEINEFTAPGYVACLLSLLNFGLVTLFINHATHGNYEAFVDDDVDGNSTFRNTNNAGDETQHNNSNHFNNDDDDDDDEGSELTGTSIGSPTLVKVVKQNKNFMCKTLLCFSNTTNRE
jgi:hypothetical protein